MDEQQHHEELIGGIAEQMKPVMEKSAQAIYIYLDDTHKICNEKFAALLGYESVREWAKIEAPLADVIQDDQDTVIEVYQNAMEKMIASEIEIRLKNVKNNETIKAKMIVVPIAYSGHLFGLHFLEQI